MAENKLAIAMSPHVHSNESVKKIMYSVVIALLPAFCVSVYFFGLNAIRVTLISIASCMAIEWLIQKFLLKGKCTICDGSAIVTGMLLAFNVPANLDWWIIVIGAIVAIGIAKMTFGGLGNNPFNPAIVGRVFLLISFPSQMTTWPTPQPIWDIKALDAVTGPTPLGLLNEGGVQAISDNYMEMFLGNMGGSLGEMSAIALLIGGIFLLIRRVITWHIPVAVLGTIAAFTAILWGIDPSQYANPLFHLLTGGAMLGAIYMATDMVTSPMTGKGMLIYGVGIGIITVLIRTWGAYPEGMSFAILIMNAIVPLINNWCKPKRFGEVPQKPKEEVKK